MTPQSSIPDSPEAAELAELYVAGAVSDTERELFEDRLRAGDKPYVAAYAQLRTVSETLFDATPPVAPSPAVRQALERRLAEQDAAPGFAGADATAAPDPVSQDPTRMVILRGEELDWQETGVPGVRTRNMFVDHASNRLTVLIQMDAGAHYPNHDHPGVEECMVVDGDLHIAGTVLHKHDYLRTPKGGDHGEPWTEHGCLLLVTIPLAA